MISGFVVSVLLGENFLSSNQTNTSFIWYSSCSETPISWAEFDGSVFNTVIGLSHLAVVFFTIIIQIVIYVRQRQLEKQRREEILDSGDQEDPWFLAQLNSGIMVEIYDEDGVTTSNRNGDQSSKYALSRHYRTVVTPKASVLSFIVIFPYYFLILLSGYMPNVDKDPLGPPVFGQFLPAATQVYKLVVFSPDNECTFCSASEILISCDKSDHM